MTGAFCKILSFNRLKPLDIDNSGGTAAGKQITEWRDNAILMSADSGATKIFDQSRTISPEATQEEVYDVVARPLVASFVEGFDVDLLSYGQTCSGKTFTMFGPPRSMDLAARKADAGTFELAPEHGFVLRAGLEVLELMADLKAKGCKALLHASMVEMSILTWSDQTVRDLQQGWAVCFVDDDCHLQGAEQKELECPEDVARFAGHVEERLTRGTKMNDTSSRSHCIAGLRLTVLGEDGVGLRESRLQFFDLMGSERFKGQNAAHDESKSSWSTASGFEGIYSNLSLMALTSCIKSASEMRRKNARKATDDGNKKKKVLDKLPGMLLTKVEWAGYRQQQR